MPETTPNGAPYPLPEDPNDVPGYLRQLAEWADENLAAGATLNDATMAAAVTAGGQFAEGLQAAIGVLAALVVDMNGNPLGEGHVVIKVDTAHGNVIDDIVWLAS